MIVQFADLHLVKNHAIVVNARQHLGRFNNRFKRTPSFYSKTFSTHNINKPFIWWINRIVYSIIGDTVPVITVQQVKVPGSVSFGQDLHMVSCGFNGFDDLPSRRRVVPGRIGVAGEAQVNGFACDVLFLQLLDCGLNNALTRGYVGVEFFPVHVQDIRRKAVKTLMRAACINVDCEVSILFGLSFGGVNGLHCNFSNFSNSSGVRIGARVFHL